MANGEGFFGRASATGSPNTVMASLLVAADAARECGAPNSPRLKPIPFELRQRIHSFPKLVATFEKSPALEAGAARGERGCNWSRGTRRQVQPQPAFEVAHLAAGGNAFGFSSVVGLAIEGSFLTKKGTQP